MRCEIIKDLLPLYCDNALSDVSKEAVEDHIAVCKDCKKVFEEMKNGDIKIDTSTQNIAPMTKVKKKIRATKIIFTAFIAAFILLGAAYELLCAHPMLASSKNISFTPSVTKVDVYRYFDDIEQIPKEIQIPKGSDFKIDTYSNFVYLNDEKLLDENEKPIPATGEFYQAGSMRVYIHVDNKLTALKYRVDQKYDNNAVSAKIEFRPCLPFRQDIDNLTDENGLVWSAPLRDISEKSKLVIRCRDKDITIELNNFIKDSE